MNTLLQTLAKSPDDFFTYLPGGKAALTGYLSSGNDPWLTRLSKLPGDHWLLARLATASQYEPTDSPVIRRFWKLCAALAQPKPLAVSIGCWTRDTPEFPARLAAATHELASLKIPLPSLLPTLLRWAPVLDPDDHPTTYGEMTLQLADAPLFLCLKEAWNHIPQTSVIRLLERCAPDRLRQLLSTKASPVAADDVPLPAWLALARSPVEANFTVAHRAAGCLKHAPCRCELACVLAEFHPQRFSAFAQESATHLLATDDLWISAAKAAVWLVAQTRLQHQAALEKYFATPLSPATDKWQRSHRSECKRDALKPIAKQLAADATPLLAACFATDQGDVQLCALEHWIALHDPAQTPVIIGHFRTAFAGTDPAAAARGLTPDELGDLARISGKSTEATPAVQE